MHLQSLEKRVLFAFATSVVNGELIINCDDGNNSVYLNSAEGNQDPSFNYLQIDGEVLPIKIGQYSRVTINTNGGNDTFEVSRGTAVEDVYVNLGDGDDVGYGGYNVKLIDGGRGNDEIGGADSVLGGEGNDIINDHPIGESSYSSHAAFLSGGSGNDVIRSRGGNDTIEGGAGNDTIYTGDDPFSDDFTQIDAGAGHDRLYLSAPGNVVLGDGDDRLYFDSVLTDPGPLVGVYGTVYGGSGRDWIQVKDTALLRPGKFFKLYGDGDDDSIIGSRQNDSLYGGAGNDLIYGNLGDDMLEGGTGDDTLYGDAGNDRLYGGYGNDSLIGGKGNDRLYGQLGIDTLVANDGAKDSLYGGEEDDVYIADPIDLIFD